MKANEVFLNAKLIPIFAKQLGVLKLQEWTLENWTLRHKFTAVVNVGLDNDGLNIGGQTACYTLSNVGLHATEAYSCPMLVAYFKGVFMFLQQHVANSTTVIILSDSASTN